MWWRSVRVLKKRPHIHLLRRKTLLYSSRVNLASKLQRHSRGIVIKLSLFAENRRMAEAIASVITEEILKKLLSLAFQEIGRAWGFEEDLQKLRDTLSSIQALLEDAETQQVKDKSVSRLLTKLRDVAYDADDVLDEVATDFQLGKMETQIPKMKKVRKFFSPSNPIAFRFKMAHKIKNINKKLEDIAKGMDGYQFRTIPVTGSSGAVREGRETRSIVEEDDLPVVGRDGDKTTIVETLISSSNDEMLSVLPIVGMGGLGKTALARFAYNDELVEKHFNLRMWVCVYDDFDVKRLIKEMIESATKDACNVSNFDTITGILQDKLRGQRFLLVLDDVWNEDVDKWGSLKSSLGNGADKGCKILVTTRNENVATAMGKLPMYHLLPTYHLKELSEVHCWAIFRNRAFGNGGVEETPNLVKIGQEIVEKCRGLPLAVKTLGGLMGSKREENEWEYVRDNEIWKDENNKILPALRLSYVHLPRHLKQCFSYCSIFPKDYRIKKDMLIQIWIAQGFVQPAEGSDVMLEDTANEYFNSLLWRSFFQGISEYGNIEWYVMHDLVHDLAQSVDDGNECLILQADKLHKVHERTRHLSFLDRENVETLQVQKALLLTKASSLRTFKSHVIASVKLTHKIFLTFKSLRVLDLSDCRLAKLSPSIAELKHLRYLDLSHNSEIRDLPDSITNLYNLQTLNLLGCDNFFGLPKGITKMINLRHLIIDRYLTSCIIPKGIGKLSNLQTLPMLTVDKDNGPSIEELGHLPHLRGELTITSLQNLRNGEESSTAKLKDKQNLSRLELLWLGVVDDNIDADDVMEGLQPPPRLKELKIEHFPGMKIPSWMMTMTGGGDGGLQQQQQQQLCCLTSSTLLLPSLERLEFGDCKNLESMSNMSNFPSLKTLAIHNCEKLTSLPEKGLGNLTSLQSLTIKNCPNLKYPPTEIQGLKSLRELRIEDCLNLTSLPVELQGLTLLQKLMIEECPNLTSLSAGIQGLTSLQELNICKCPNLTSLLAGIQGLTSLKKLKIGECPAAISLLDGVQGLTLLQELSILNCPNMTSLPFEIQCLTSLTKLNIDGCPVLTSLPAGIQSLASLKILIINECPTLTSLLDGIHGLTSLKELRISNCRNLTSLLVGIQLTSLNELDIRDCPNLTSLSVGIQGFPSLIELWIGECPALTSLLARIETLTSLQLLSISNWPNLTSLPTGILGLTSLRDLMISDCPTLGYLPDGIQSLTSLKRLTIRGCLVLTSLPPGIHGLVSLDWLEISNCPNLTCLPPLGIQGHSSLRKLMMVTCPVLTSPLPKVQGLTSLQWLSIKECPNLISFPTGIQDLTSLKDMWIRSCSKLTSLPAEIKGLTSLQLLWISDCPTLSKRCEREKGKDWHKISHIPTIWIR